MRVAVIGHGPSLKGAGLGKEIDAFDKVVRLKGSHTVLGSDDYGTKVDALCSSTEIMGTFLKMDAPEYWAYPKTGVFNPQIALSVICKLQKPVMIPLELSNKMNEEFRFMGAAHPNVSTGTAAAVFAWHRWKSLVTLYGFDTIKNPHTKFDRNGQIPRSGVGEYPNHDWYKEQLLLKEYVIGLTFI